MALMEKWKIRSIGKVVAKSQTLVHGWWEWNTVPSFWNTVWQFPNKLKCDDCLVQWVPSLETYPGGGETETETDICTPMFMGLLASMPNNSSTHWWVHEYAKCGCTCTVVYYSAWRRVKLKDSNLHKISRTEKDKYCMISFSCST